jgi:hypothetical protein
MDNAVKDILYASVRTTAIISSVLGTVHGTFWIESGIANDRQEADIEVITYPKADGTKLPCVAPLETEASRALATQSAGLARCNAPFRSSRPNDGAT